MRHIDDGRSSQFITLRDLAWDAIESAYERGHLNPVISLALGRRYAAHVADEKEDSLVRLTMPLEALEEKKRFGKIYGVEGIGFRLGPVLRRHTQMVSYPSELPQDEDWIALSGGKQAVIAVSGPETTEYLEARLATRNTPKGLNQLADFLHREGAMLAASDGERVFRMPNGSYFYPENMLSAMSQQIRHEYVSERQRRPASYPSSLRRRGHLVLVR